MCFDFPSFQVAFKFADIDQSTRNIVRKPLNPILVLKDLRLVKEGRQATSLGISEFLVEDHPDEDGEY